MFKRVHHVQLAMPSGGEAEARAFFIRTLGMEELPKPEALHGRGGCWFRAGTVELHLGVEADFQPARKAHPAFEVDDLAVMETRLSAAGVSFTRDVDLPRFRRIFVRDPFGNRIEILECCPSAAT